MQSILNRLFPREPLPSISIMGLDAAGKTQLLHTLASSEVITTIPTIGLNIETANILVPPPINNGHGGKNQRFAARVYDTGGCSKVEHLVRPLMIDETVSAIVWVIDANDTDRLVESPEELGILLPKLGTKSPDIAPTIPIMM